MTYTATEILLRIAEQEAKFAKLRLEYLDELERFAWRVLHTMLIRYSWVTYNPQLLLTYEP